MLNYGFDDLRLVNPKCSPDDGETRARANRKRVCLARVRCGTFGTPQKEDERSQAVPCDIGHREHGGFLFFLYQSCDPDQR